MKNVTDIISESLRVLRKKKGWSLDVASQNTQVSKAMLGQIERGESSPTIATLWKIATGFNVSLSYFVSQDNNNIVLAGDNSKHIKLQDEKILISSLFPFDKNLSFEAFIVELLPNHEHFSEPHQAGVTEHIIVAQGAIDVFINGVWNTLQENQGLTIDADQYHGYRNVTKQKAVFYNLIHYKNCNSALASIHSGI